MEQKLEEEGYEEAKIVRREILKEVSWVSSRRLGLELTTSQSHRKATRRMSALADRASKQSFAEMAELVPLPHKGLESRPVIEKLEDLYDTLNAQANQLDEWREYVIQLLLKPLVDEEGDIETTGEEFADSADLQEALMVHVQALRAGIADRQDALSGQTNELIKHETKVALTNAKSSIGPAPLKLIELLAVREKIKPTPAQGSLRGAIGELRALLANLNRSSGAEGSRAIIEHSIVEEQLKATQAHLTAQTKVAQAMEKEIDQFTGAMNARVEYYRQLQVVSDSVAPYEGPKDEATMGRFIEQENAMRKKLATAESKHRYRKPLVFLLTFRKNGWMHVLTYPVVLNLKETGSKSNEPRLCVICQLTFTTGVLTVCGHQFCKECIMLWFKSHHNCPVCKRQLAPNNLHDIVIRARDLKVHTEAPPAERETHQSPRSNKTGIYSEFSQEKLTQIQDMELDGPSFPTKVDNLVRHLLWLRESDPGAKSIIFSQYVPFLRGWSYLVLTP